MTKKYPSESSSIANFLLWCDERLFVLWLLEKEVRSSYVWSHSSASSSFINFFSQFFSILHESVRWFVTDHLQTTKFNRRICLVHVVSINLVVIKLSSLETHARRSTQFSQEDFFFVVFLLIPKRVWTKIKLKKKRKLNNDRS